MPFKEVSTRLSRWIRPLTFLEGCAVGLIGRDDGRHSVHESTCTQATVLQSGVQGRKQKQKRKKQKKNFLLLALAPRERLQTFGLSETPDEPQHVYCEPRRSNRGQVKC